jgi:hypothetical protein
LHFPFIQEEESAITISKTSSDDTEDVIIVIYLVCQTQQETMIRGNRSQAKTMEEHHLKEISLEEGNKMILLA